MGARAAGGDLDPHGRTALISGDGRHQRGWHADLNTLTSSLAVLERQEEAA